MDQPKFFGPVSRLRYLRDAVQKIEESPEVTEANIFILPPESGDKNCDSDEEVLPDEVLDVPLIPNEIPGKVEVEVSSHIDEEKCELFEPPPPQKKKKQLHGQGETSKSNSEKSIPDWKKSEEVLFTCGPEPVDKVGDEHLGKSEFEIFSLFFTPEIIEFIMQQTNLYARRDKNDHTFEVTYKDICKFLGLLLISGYHYLPSENDCWSTAPDLSAPIYAATMSRDRFRLIKRYIHVADNNHLSNSKVAKIYEKLNEKFQQFGIFYQSLSIDESMVPYHGHHSAKMFIKNKPIRFGIKIWMLCGTDDYPYNMSVYCGKSNTTDPSPLGSRVVNGLLSAVKNPSQHIVYFDNFFTSYNLLHELRNYGFRACGTIRENRTKKCPLLSSKEVQKKDRGYFDCYSDESIACVKWNDNAVVTVASNCFSVRPLHMTRRRVKQENKKEVQQPHCIKMYNEGMGGVDLLDRLLSTYRPRLRTKKWWWNLFSNALNMAVVAGFRFFQYLNPNSSVTHKDFRRAVAIALIKSDAIRTRLGGPTTATIRDMRFDGVNHHLSPTSQGRCVVCLKNTRLLCGKCSKRLHKKFCYERYHKK